MLMGQIVQNVKDLCSVVKDVYDGYRFAESLAEDVRARLHLVKTGRDTPLSNFGIVLQVIEYKERMQDVQEGICDMCSTGVGIYALTHRQTDQMLTSMYERLVQRST